MAASSFLAESDFLGIIFWAIVLLGLATGAFFGYGYLKRWIKEEEAVSDTPATGFTLSDLRQLHRTGAMTDAEFEAAKTLIVGAMKKTADAMPPVLSKDRKGNIGKPPPAA